MNARVSLGRAIAAELAFRAQPRRRAARFFPEREAQRRTLGPGLPHHRHPMTVDEALAGLALLALIVGAAFYLGWKYL